MKTNNNKFGQILHMTKGGSLKTLDIFEKQILVAFRSKIWSNGIYPIYDFIIEYGGWYVLSSDSNTSWYQRVSSSEDTCGNDLALFR